MDRFQYELNIKKIDTLKTAVAKERLARDLYRQMSDIMHRWGGGIKAGTTTIHVKYLYKCLAKLLPLYTAKSKLPQYIYDAKSSAENWLIDEYNKESVVNTYEEFINTFEYVEVINLRSHTPEKFKSTVLLVADNTPPFTIKYGFYNTSRFSYLLDTISKYGNPAKVIIELEEFKRSLPNDVRYTMIEDYLEESYKNIRSSTKINIPSFLNNLDGILADLEISANTMREKLTT